MRKHVTKHPFHRRPHIAPKDFEEAAAQALKSIPSQRLYTQRPRERGEEGGEEGGEAYTFTTQTGQRKTFFETSHTCDNTRLRDSRGRRVRVCDSMGKDGI